MDKETWRRSNVDSVILQLHYAIREVKSRCKFGISPFGVWRNFSSDSLGSFTIKPGKPIMMICTPIYYCG